MQYACPESALVSGTYGFHQWYNTNFHSATQLTPFEIVYNQPQPHHMAYLPRECEHEKVDRPFILKTNIHILLVNCNFPFDFS